MTDAEALARLRLLRSSGIGPVGFRTLLAKAGSAQAACARLEAEGRPLAAPAAIAAEVQQVAQLGARHLHLGTPDYPPLLAEIADAPPVLVASGRPELGPRPAVAIVGARNASVAGRRLAQELAAELGAAGWVVVSGLARGIDAAAHRGAFDSGTIACIAGGIDIAYPPENARLQQAIAGGGLMLSEFPPGTEPIARFFPRRNRLIAGIAAGLVVIEAAHGSGSLITARMAGDFGREVMAVPGHPADPRSKGGNGLIRDGATLVETAADVLAVLAPFAVAPAPAPAPAQRRRRAAPPAAAAVAPAPLAAGTLLDFLSTAGVALDELVRVSGLPAAVVQAQLSDLELDGAVVRLAGGRVARAG